MTDRLIRTVGNWHAASWRHGERIPLVRAACADLAAAAAAAEHRAVPVVPELDPHALADQLTVLAADAVASGVPADQVQARLQRLAADLGLPA
jgi:hypothetical protein